MRPADCAGRGTRPDAAVGAAPAPRPRRTGPAAAARRRRPRAARAGAAEPRSAAGPCLGGRRRRRRRRPRRRRARRRPRRRPTAPPPPPSRPAAVDPGSRAARRWTSAAVLDAVQPSVVTIEVNGDGAGGRRSRRAGSGVVISDDGLVLTNAHVDRRRQPITVRFFDGDDRRRPSWSAASPTTTSPSSGSTDTDGPGPGDARRLGRPAGRRRGRGHRQRPRPHRPADRDPGHRLGPRPRDRRRRRHPRQPHPDRRRHQPRQLRRCRSSPPTARVVGINTAIIDDAQNIGFAIAIDAVEAADRRHPGRQRRDHARHRLPRRVAPPTSPTSPTAVLERFGVDADERRASSLEVVARHGGRRRRARGGRRDHRHRRRGRRHLRPRSATPIREHEPGDEVDHRRSSATARSWTSPPSSARITD